MLLLLHKGKSHCVTVEDHYSVVALLHVPTSLSVEVLIFAWTWHERQRAGFDSCIVMEALQLNILQRKAASLHANILSLHADILIARKLAPAAQHLQG